MSGSVHLHRGDHFSISEPASPGLTFLKCLLPVLDALQPNDKELESLIHPSAHFIVNGGEPQGISTVKHMLENRSKHLSKFQHTVHRVWDIVPEEHSDRRTVMYESTSTTVFKSDVEKQEVRIEEFSVIELIKSEANDHSKGVDNWVAIELRTYMDPKLVVDRASQLLGAH